MTAAPESALGDGGYSPRHRSAARLAAVQALYEMEMVGADADAVLEDFLQRRWTEGTPPADGDDGESAAAQDPDRLVEPDSGWMGDLVHGIATRRNDLDRLVGGALSGELTSERLETLLRVILRAGAYELTAKPEVPAAAVITEYLEVTRAFFDDREVRLVNGVLDRLSRAERPGEA